MNYRVEVDIEEMKSVQIFELKKTNNNGENSPSSNKQRYFSVGNKNTWSKR
jgi:hypothetical protein